MTTKVAIVRFEDNETESLQQALRLINGINDLNTSEREVVIKVGVFSHRAENHTSVRVVDAIIDSFSEAPKIYLAESDNYQGTGLERLQIWKELFSERVVPFSLSDEADRDVRFSEEDMKLSHILFKPNVLVDTHILRAFESGSILKNLFGCIPTSKKRKFHKILGPLLADIYEAIGGVDLAVLDGTHFWHGAGDTPVRMNALLVGRDAVAVETVGATLAGLKLEKMPVLQEFIKKGLGEGDLQNIEILGTTLDTLRKEFVSAAKTQRKLRSKRREPQTWGGLSYCIMEDLIKEGFFKLPNRRTRKDVALALKAKGLSTEAKERRIANSLSRRVKRGALKATKGSDGWVYWTE